MSDHNARKISLSILREWEESSKFIDSIIDKKFRSNDLGHLDKSYTQNIVLGVIRNLSLLDHFVEKLRNSKMSSETRRVLYIGIYQILLMRTPDHAAVNETVNLANGKSRGMVNAILRRCVREKENLLEEKEDMDPADKFSIPDHIYARWEKQLGKETSMDVAANSNIPAKLMIRSNELLGGLSDEDLTEIDATRIDQFKDFYEVKKLPLKAIADGRCYVQDPSTSIAPYLLNPDSNHTVLDACASPGGKTAILSSIMSNEGKIIASDIEGPRSERLLKNLKRLGVKNTEILSGDLRETKDALENENVRFDRILVDAPCSNSGVFRRRADAKWRLMPNYTNELIDLQLELLSAVIPLMKKGGKLVYSTCSIDAEENTGVISKIIETHTHLEKLDEVQLIPNDINDGAYAALLG